MVSPTLTRPSRPAMSGSVTCTVRTAPPRGSTSETVLATGSTPTTSPVTISLAGGRAGRHLTGGGAGSGEVDLVLRNLLAWRREHENRGRRVADHHRIAGLHL